MTLQLRHHAGDTKAATGLRSVMASYAFLAIRRWTDQQGVGVGLITHLARFLTHIAQLRSKASFLSLKQSSALTGSPRCNCSHDARSLASSHVEQPAKANETSAKTKTFLIGRICASTHPFSSMANRRN